MRHWLLTCLLGGLTLSAPALAQEEEDAPYAYPDEEEEREQKPRSSSRTRYSAPAEDEAPAAPRRPATQKAAPARQKAAPAQAVREADAQEEEEEGEFERLYRSDDPNTGIAGEVIAGALLLDSSRGQFAEAGLGLGLRFTWEFGRLFDSETLRDALWSDVRWTFGGMQDGTTLISAKTSLHYFTVAPAYELTFGKSGFGAYAQVGGGVAYQTSSLLVGANTTEVSGMRPVFQYGVGLRGRPLVAAGPNLHLAFRLELTRFRRGYMDDTFIGGSFGAAF